VHVTVIALSPPGNTSSSCEESLALVSVLPYAACLHPQQGREYNMKKKYSTYCAYSIGCFLVWGLILAVRAALGNSSTTHNILLVFGGWCILVGPHRRPTGPEGSRWLPLDIVSTA
jgi:hypothetical protein